MKQVPVDLQSLVSASPNAAAYCWDPAAMVTSLELPLFLNLAWKQMLQYPATGAEKKQVPVIVQVLVVNAAFSVPEAYASIVLVQPVKILNGRHTNKDREQGTEAKQYGFYV